MRPHESRMAFQLVGKSAHPGPEESLIISMLRQARLNLSDPQQQKRLMR